MGKANYTRWTCDRCNVALDMSGSDEPAQWESIQLPKDEPRLLCRQCAADLRRWIGRQPEFVAGKP